MLGTYGDHVWPSFISRPARALEFPILSQHGLGLIFTGPCQSANIFRTESTWSKANVYRVLVSEDHVGTRFGLNLLSIK